MGRVLVQRVLRLVGTQVTTGHETPCQLSLSCLPAFAEETGPDGDKPRRWLSYRLRCTEGVTRRKGGGTQSRRRAPRSDIGKKKTPKH